MPTLHRLCVYAGSNVGTRPEYAVAAAALAERMVARGIGLVYGGGQVVLMGVLADTILGAGGEAVGVMPQALVNREHAHTGLTRLEVVGSMHERKALMAKLADGFVAVPGGIGTLEELGEVLTWSQLGIHAKPCAVLDVAGFYSGLSGLLDHMVREGFLHAENRARLISTAQPEALLDRLGAWEPPTVTKWLDLGRS
jgi:uncharacterized protein (TIGR00730 family)